MSRKTGRRSPAELGGGGLRGQSFASACGFAAGAPGWPPCAGGCGEAIVLGS